MEYINPTNFNGELEDIVYNSSYFADRVSAGIINSPDSHETNLNTVAKIKNEDTTFSDEIIIIAKKGELEKYRYDGNNRDTIISISSNEKSQDYGGKVICGTHPFSIYRFTFTSRKFGILEYSSSEMVEIFKTKCSNLLYTKYINDKSNEYVICVKIQNPVVHFDFCAISVLMPFVFS
jgi:hypothetical protein